jgi:hypothetical protein
MIGSYCIGSFFSYSISYLVGACNVFSLVRTSSLLGGSSFTDFFSAALPCTSKISFKSLKLLFPT